MGYFDFHVHPTLKCMFSEATSKTSPWVDINVKKIPWVLRWCTEFEYILGSQADLRMLHASGTDLLVVALYVAERGITTSPLILGQAKGTLSTYLDPIRLQQMNDGTLKPYPDLVNEDLDVLLNAARFGITDKEIVPLAKDVVFNPDDTSKTYVVFSVEGMHTLSPTLDASQFDKNVILKNFDELSSRIPIISVNITHLEQYPFCNHAYGILYVTAEDFRPTGNRIAPDGIDIIRHCYERNVMIDIKHQSLAARKMFIQKIRTDPAFLDILQPLVCTHAGFTGLSYNEVGDYFTYQKVDKKNYSTLTWGKPKKYGMLDFMVAFNPSSINLFDEDIVAILQSGGMIGLSLDKRILGYTEARHQHREYLLNHNAQFHSYVL